MRLDTRNKYVYEGTIIIIMSMIKFNISPEFIKTILLSILTIEVVASVYYQTWMNALIVLGIVILSTLPMIFAKHFSVALPAEFDLATIIFIFAAIFLGELSDFYERFWWWDKLLHMTSGLLFGMFGLYLIWVLNNNERIDLELSPRFMCLFAFTFALSVGTIWEIFEFGMDNLFGLNMQQTGLDDTMSDLMIDALGAFIVSLGANSYFSTREKSLMSYWIKRFITLTRKKLRQK